MTLSPRDLKTLQSILARRQGFGHREHLELAWHYLQDYDLQQAHRVVASAIRQVADLHGAPNKYHETITSFWIRLVAIHATSSGAESFDQFIAENPRLLSSDLLLRHYSRGLLQTQNARAAALAPDLRELPQTHS